MIRLSAAARRQLAELRAYYDAKDRIDAVRRLRVDLADAQRRIEANPVGGASYPRPSPALARFDMRWIKARIYWVSWQVTSDGIVITNFLHERGDFARRASATTE